MCGLVCKLERKKQVKLRKKCLFVSCVVVSLNGIYWVSHKLNSLWSLGWEWKCSELRLVRVFLGDSSLLVTRNLRILSFFPLTIANCFLTILPKVFSPSQFLFKFQCSLSLSQLMLFPLSLSLLLSLSRLLSSHMLCSTTRKRLCIIFYSNFPTQLYSFVDRIPCYDHMTHSNGQTGLNKISNPFSLAKF